MRMWSQQGSKDNSLKDRVLAGRKVLGSYVKFKGLGEGRRGVVEGTGSKVPGTQGPGGCTGMWHWSKGQIRKGVGVELHFKRGENSGRACLKDFFSVKEGEATCMECSGAGMGNKV